MFAIILTYKKPLDEVDEVMPAHVDWLQGHYDAGEFLLSGRRVPREGGVILTGPLERARLDEILAADPFNPSGIADYTVVEFELGTVAPGLEHLRESRDK
jgi:uncharacterized protein YciI